MPKFAIVKEYMSDNVRYLGIVKSIELRGNGDTISYTRNYSEALVFENRELPQEIVAAVWSLREFEVMEWEDVVNF